MLSCLCDSEESDEVVTCISLGTAKGNVNICDGEVKED